MGIGGGIALFVLGAILAFAVEVDIPGLDDNAIGWILMLAGVVTVVLALVVSRQRQHRHTIVEERGVVPVEEHRRIV